MPGCDASFCSAKLIVFDFDETISITHVFKQLSSNGEGKSATSELGQLRLLDELDSAGNNSIGSFARWCIGGEQRLEQLRRFLISMRDRGVCLVVCSFGLAATASKVLSQLSLLEFFSEVYGRGDNKYKRMPFDKKQTRGADPSERSFLADVEHYKWNDKADVIRKLLGRLQLKRSEVIFVDNDIKMLRNTQGLCWTIWVKMNKGMTKEHLDEMEWRTRPTRVPRLLASCFELFADWQLSRHTEAQLTEAKENAYSKITSVPSDCTL